MIFNTEPNTWQELQDYVGQMFEECGFTVEISKTIDLVRGRKEIDVYAQDLNSEYKPIFLVECKFWNNPIPQEIIHSFRTVVSDSGANTGFIVSKNGFQSGSFNSAKLTNIKLVTLKELETEYYSKWKKTVAKKYMDIADKLFPYWDPSGGKTPKDGRKIDWDKHQLLNDAYRPITSLGVWDLERNGFKRKYPKKVPVLNDDLEIIDIIILKNDREYFDFVEQNKEKALEHYKKLYRE